MTSNLGSEELMRAIEKKGDLSKEEVLKILEPSLKRHFRPEFLNRLDDILPFLPLKESEMRRIVELQLEQVAQRLSERHIKLDWTVGVADYLAKEGYDPAFGARPLKRTIQHLVVGPLSKALLEGKLAGQKEITLELAGDEIVFAHHTAAAGR